MTIYDKCLTAAKVNNISTILFFNDYSIKKNELIELNKFIPNIFVSFYNSFTLRSFLVQLKHHKNIHIVEPNMIPLINYDIISTNELTNPINLILSKINTIKYLIITGDIFPEPPIGYKIDESIEKTFKKNDDLIVFENSLDKTNFKSELIKNNRNEINKISSKSINENVEENKIKNNKKNSILIKNITSTKTKFSSNNFKFNINDGQLDIFSILELKKDYDRFLNIIKYFNKNYKKIKFYIFLNGSTILKYFNENDVENFDYILLKSSIKNDEENYKKIFNIISDGTYQIDYKKINLTKNVLDIINEDCTNITNI